MGFRAGADGKADAAVCKPGKEITEQNKTLSQQVENKNLEIESASQDLNDILLEIAQKQQQKNFPAAEYPAYAEEIRRLNQEKEQICMTVQTVRL